MDSGLNFSSKKYSTLPFYSNLELKIGTGERFLCNVEHRACGIGSPDTGTYKKYECEDKQHPYHSDRAFCKEIKHINTYTKNRLLSVV